jgi:hypothetical protein
MPFRNVGYDVMALVGLQRFCQHQQREEIQDMLREEYDLIISTGEISALQLCFVSYLQRLHVARTDAIRRAFIEDGGWPLHVDATGEDGRGTLLIAYAGWRRWVLGAWKIPTEHGDAILPCLRKVAQCFGPPVAIVRDLGRAMIPTINTFLSELDIDIPVLSCHQHFLKDVGNDLLQESYGELRNLFRRFRIRPGLRDLARSLGRTIGEDIDGARGAVAAWGQQEDSSHHLPEGVDGLATVRALAQWVLDYAAEGNDVGAPFDRPYLDLYERCTKARRAVDAFLRTLPMDDPVRRALHRLRKVLHPVASEVPFAQVTRTLNRRAALFDELRDALRLAPKPTGRNQPDPPPSVGSALTADEFQDIQRNVENLVADLRHRRPQRGPAGDQRQAIDLVLRHLDAYGDSLWGHVITWPEHDARGTRTVDRTNYLIESLNCAIKRAERRRSGRKRLTQDMEHFPAGAALAFNLNDEDYVRLMCGSLDQLPSAFADLDRDGRQHLLQGLTPPSRVDFFEPPTSIASASLQREDRTLVRNEGVKRRFVAAARSRAPRTGIARQA